MSDNCPKLQSDNVYLKRKVKGLKAQRGDLRRQLEQAQQRFDKATGKSYKRSFDGEGKYDSQWDAFDDGYCQGAGVLNERLEELAVAQAENKRLRGIVDKLAPIGKRLIARQSRPIKWEDRDSWEGVLLLGQEACALAREAAEACPKQRESDRG